MAYVSKEQMNNASAIFNLLRNLGGSFGIAFVTTLLARRTQFHQSRLIENFYLYNPGFSYRLDELKFMFEGRLGSFSDNSNLALGYIYSSLQKQTAMLAYCDVFYALAVIFVFLTGFLWIIRKPPSGQKFEMPAELHIFQ
jgi:DHA2 family multidrug resistance protein